MAERARLVLQVGDVKRARQMAVYDPERERRVLEKLGKFVGVSAPRPWNGSAHLRARIDPRDAAYGTASRLSALIPSVKRVPATVVLNLRHFDLDCRWRDGRQIGVFGGLRCRRGLKLVPREHDVYTRRCGHRGRACPFGEAYLFALPARQRFAALLLAPW